MKKIIFFILSSVLVMSCSDGGDSSNSSSLSVTIDGESFAFTCNRSEFTGSEYEVSCNNQQSKRLVIYKAFETNGGEVKVLLVDVPDSALFDSPYGISYECGSIPLLSRACNTTAIPVYDGAKTTITAADVVLPETDNNTAQFGTFVNGEGMHTISFSVNAESVQFFQ